MEGMKNLASRSLLALALAAVGAAFVATAWAAPAPSPIRRQVADAVVRDLKLDFSSAAVEQKLDVLAPFASLPEGAAIHVVSARPGFAGTWQLQLDCVSRRDCLPFHVVLHLPSSEELSIAGGASTAKMPRASTPGKHPTAAALVHRGEPVVLMEELSGMRLRVPAVCLEAGGLGDEVRVQNRATHRALLATVVDGHTVRVER